MNRKFMFSFLVFVGFCSLSDAHEESWDDVVLGRVIVCYDNSIDIHKASLSELGIANKGVFEIVTESVGPLNFVVVQVPKDIEEMKKFMELMEKQPNVKYVEPDRWGEFVFTPNDYYYSSQYDKPQMNCENAWDYTKGDMSISIAVVDQGTQYDHPDLAAQYGTYKGYDYLDNDADPMPASTSERHGTHCSGTAAAVINNTIGIAGVANVTLYSYRCGSGSSLTVIAAVNSIQDAVAHGVNVISMSWGFTNLSTTLYNGIKHAWDAGCLLCGASGNDGSSGAHYPSTYSEVICVGAIRSNNQRWSDSNYGLSQELVAGGTSIMSTVPFDNYTQLSGTSMACPNIAGAAALVWSANPGLTGEQVRAVLCSTATDLGSSGWDQYYGYGKPDLCAAIQSVDGIIALNDYRFNEPNDGIWDPGEMIDIIVTLKAYGKSFTNVSAVLSTTDSDVNITTSGASFGSISDGNTKDNASSPFVASASASATHEVSFTLDVTAEGGYSDQFSFTLSMGTERFDHADIEAGNAKLTVTDIASIGYDAPGSNGSGFIYPANGLNALYYGSMSFGNSSSYLVDNWYVLGEEDNDWQPTITPNGRLKWITPPIEGDTMLLCYYKDSGHPSPKNVVCEQYAWGFRDDPSCDDFVLLQFKYTNEGTSPITGLYSAIFADFDIGGEENAGINESKYLAWIDDGSVYAGITLLGPVTLVKNVSTIKNETYVYPCSGMTDDNQYIFMDSTLHFGSQANQDYSVMVSAGPFDLSGGASQAISFAIVGGSSQTDIENHADEARNCYRRIGVKEKEKIVSRHATLKVTPNPVLNTGVITFFLPSTGKAIIDIYDIAGRKLQTLTQKGFKTGVHTLKWDVSSEKIPTGVFFVKLKTAETTLVKKVIVF